MTIAIENGKEHQVSSSSLVSINGKLPYYQELRTSTLLNVLTTFSSKQDKNLRKKINQWLYSRTRPGFYLELNDRLHLAYADQRDGHGSQHWWRLFFDEQYQQQIENATKSSALTVGTKASSSDRTSGNHNAYKEWGGMYFRSEAEIAIAEELDKRNVLFFGNIRGRLNEKDLPAAKASQCLSGRVELDFLVFKDRKCMILEVDGQHHQEGTQTMRDYVRDRVLLREGIPTARFTAQECITRAADVVTEFLELF
jgi:very-short-patch-repair endonuclease